MPRVLIVDDDLVSRTVLEGMARAMCHETVSVSDALSAMLAIEEARGRFDIVVTDIMMPGIDGIHLAMLIRDMYPDLPVVAVTAGGEAVADRFTAAGGRDVINKPISLDTLQALIARNIPEAL